MSKDSDTKTERRTLGKGEVDYLVVDGQRVKDWPKPQT